MQAGEAVSFASRIGPNAILQLLPVLEAQLGIEKTRALLNQAGLKALPDGLSMIAEEDAARLHQAVRHLAPEQASAILYQAGIRTADYILAHRIPKLAQHLLRILPAFLAARALSRAIAQHAWTFAGSGQFRVVTPWQFEIAHNPLIHGEHSDTCLCAWHAAVFERLYRMLVSRHARCEETSCGAHNGAGFCTFVFTRR
jgi:divinyl protochlorophyllide a 8-vinyl-reductase